MPSLGPNVSCTLQVALIAAKLVDSWKPCACSTWNKVNSASTYSHPTYIHFAVRQYHSTYYVPHNLSLVVTGKLSSGTSSLLAVLQEKVEPSIIAHGQDQGSRPEGWKRPFVETASANRQRIKEIIKEAVEFPEKDESQGELLITYNGPPPTAFLERKVCLIL